jgi:hypothetical protein
VTQVGLIDEKNESRKSRQAVPFSNDFNNTSVDQWPEWILVEKKTLSRIAWQNILNKK